MSKGFEAIRTTMMDYTKKSFEDGTRAFEQLAGAKSIEQAWEIQSQYAKKAFEAYVAQASKIGEMYVDLARSAYQPVAGTALAWGARAFRHLVSAAADWYQRGLLFDVSMQRNLKLRGAASSSIASSCMRLPASQRVPRGE